MERFAYKIGAQGARDRARQFMGNEIARGIVELITNSDAAYTAQGVSQPKQRPIAVVVNAAARYIEVRDRAGGMSPEVVQDKFTEGCQGRRDNVPAGRSKTVPLNATL